MILKINNYDEYYLLFHQSTVKNSISVVIDYRVIF